MSDYVFTREERKLRAKGGWFNWYVNRGRMSLEDASDPALKRAARQASWRRAH